MHHHRSSVRRGGGLDPAQEGQQARGVVGHAVLRPRREVELAHLVFGGVASLQTKDNRAVKHQRGEEGRVEGWREGWRRRVTRSMAKVRTVYSASVSVFSSVILMSP